MINTWFGTSLTVLLVLIGHLASAADRPNLIWIMADDLGYGDLGCYGQKVISTPHLDAHGEGGVAVHEVLCRRDACQRGRINIGRNRRFS